jgi:hypothetical protein
MDAPIMPNSTIQQVKREIGFAFTRGSPSQMFEVSKKAEQRGKETAEFPVTRTLTKATHGATGRNRFFLGKDL